MSYPKNTEAYPYIPSQKLFYALKGSLLLPPAFVNFGSCRLQPMQYLPKRNPSKQEEKKKRGNSLKNLITLGGYMKKRSAFTLIELLVVIAIIAILAAILFPVFARAREAARKSACLSNTKQMALAVHQYMQDWGGYLPSSADYGYVSGHPKYGFGIWMWMIFPYLKTEAIFACPSAPHRTPVWLPSNFPWPANYGYNEYILFGWLHDTNYAEESALKRPSQTALIADCFNASLFHDWGDAEDANTDWKNAPDKKRLPSGFLRIKYANGLAGGKVLQSRHEGTNIVYADAHAAFMPVSRFEFIQGRTPCQRPIIMPDMPPCP